MNNDEFINFVSKSVNWNLFTKEELEAIDKGDYSKVQKEKLKYLDNQFNALVSKKPAEEVFTTGESFTRQAERMFTYPARTAAKVGSWVKEKLGGKPDDIDFYSKAFGTQTEAEKEGQSRIMWEEDPAISMAGSIAGGVTDPTNYIPAGLVSKLLPAAGAVTKGAAGGAIAGALGGALTPTYEEYGEGIGTIAKNAGLGAGFGGIVGAVMGKFVDPTKSSSLVKQEAADAAAAEASKTGPGFPTAARVADNPGYYDAPKLDMNVPGAVAPVEPQQSRYIPETYNPLADTGAPETPTFKTKISVGQDVNNPTLHPLKGEMFVPEKAFVWYDETSAKLANIGVDVKNYSAAEVSKLADELGIDQGMVIRQANAKREWAARLSKIGVTEEPKSAAEALDQIDKLAKAGLLPDIC
jgi:hypothetical protein